MRGDIAKKTRQYVQVDMGVGQWLLVSSEVRRESYTRRFVDRRFMLRKLMSCLGYIQMPGGSLFHLLHRERPEQINPDDCPPERKYLLHSWYAHSDCTL